MLFRVSQTLRVSINEMPKVGHFPILQLQC